MSRTGERRETAGEYYRIGNGRIRIAEPLKVTALPAKRACSIAGRFVRSRVTCSSGRRCEASRRRITDGFDSWRSASSVPKSVSAEMITRSSAAALSKISLSESACNPQPFRDERRKRVVHKQPHGAVTSGNSRSRTAAAA